jgi:hypothetical protein
MFWEYHAEDPQMIPDENVPIAGLTEDKNAASIDGMSRFDINRYDKIRSALISALVLRCWRFPNLYAKYSAEDSDDPPMLVVRRWMLDLPLPPEVKWAADDLVKQCKEDWWSVANALYDSDKTICPEQDFRTQTAWAIYKHKLKSPFGAVIAVVEECLQSEYWKQLRSRIAASSSVHLTKAPDGFTATTDGAKAYSVDTYHVTCTCTDFVFRGLKTGMHCKHLIAALREQGVWEPLWGRFVLGQG